MLSLIAVVVIVAVAIAVYAATRPPPMEPWTLPIPAGTVLAFNANVQGIKLIPSNGTGPPTEYMRIFPFTVSQPTAVVEGAWSFNPGTITVYAGVIRTSLGSWGGMLSPIFTNSIRANVTAGENEFVVVASGPGNLTVTETIRFY